MERRERIAVYMRVSKEDGDFFDESGSIRMQRLMLRKFVREHFSEYELSEFQDDGYSGMNFDRPGVTAMLEQVREAALDCIIVKDFSRFSRDYIELGAYIEQIFPFMGIRFLSVNDRYDSDERAAGDLEISFRSLLYDLYSKDLSVKVKASLTVRKERGAYVSAHCPFGYQKSPDDRHMLVVRKDEAETVRRIFAMAQSGMTSVRIARTLNEEGVSTPAERKTERGEGKRTPKGGEFSWSAPTVCRMLQNEVYAGDLVYDKYRRDGPGGRTRKRPRSEWKICRDHHEPIVGREIFEAVQKNYGRKRAKGGQGRHPLTGKLVCGRCGRNLRIRSGANAWFCCPSLYDNPREGCVKRIDACCAERYVLSEMGRYIRGRAEGGRLRESRLIETERELREWERRLQAAERKAALVTKRKREAYERYRFGEADADAFREAMCAMKREEASLNEMIADIRRNITIVKERAVRTGDGSGGTYIFDMSKLTEEAVNACIEKMIVYDGGRIEICWNARALK